MKKAFLFFSLVILFISCENEKIDPPVTDPIFRPRTITSNSSQGVDAKMEFFYEDDRIVRMDYYYGIDGELSLYSKVDYQYWELQTDAISSLRDGENWKEVSKNVYQYEMGDLRLIEEYELLNNIWVGDEKIAYEYAEGQLREAFYANIDDGAVDARQLNTFIFVDMLLQQVNYSINPDDWQDIFLHENFTKTDSTWESTLIRNSDSVIWQKTIYTIEDNRFVHKDLYVRDTDDELQWAGSEDYHYNVRGLLSEIISGYDDSTEQISIVYEEGDSNLESLQNPELKAKLIPQSFLIYVDKSFKHFEQNRPIIKAEK